MHAWYDYWALRSKYLPDFVLHIFKGSLVYVTLMTWVTYSAAWFIYGVPLDDHAVFIIGSTLLSVYSHFPSFLVRLVFNAPTDLSYEQTLWDASRGYIRNYLDFVITGASISLITVAYGAFLFKSALRYRRSDKFWDYVLATVLLFLFLLCLSAFALVYYVLAPFVIGSLKESFAFHTIRTCWRIAAWIQSLHAHAHAEQRRQAYHKAQTSEAFNGTEFKSSNPSRI